MSHISCYDRSKAFHQQRFSSIVEPICLVQSLHTSTCIQLTLTRHSGSQHDHTVANKSFLVQILNFFQSQLEFPCLRFFGKFKFFKLPENPQKFQKLNF